MHSLVTAKQQPQHMPYTKRVALNCWGMASEAASCAHFFVRVCARAHTRPCVPATAAHNCAPIPVAALHSQHGIVGRRLVGFTTFSAADLLVGAAPWLCQAYQALVKCLFALLSACRRFGNWCAWPVGRTAREVRWAVSHARGLNAGLNSDAAAGVRLLHPPCLALATAA
jgi:hypothetical protein